MLSLVEVSGTVDCPMGRWAVSKSDHSSGDVLAQCYSIRTAADISGYNSMCSACGAQLTDQLPCADCSISFCELCDSSDHKVSGECFLIKEYAARVGAALPVQGLLAHRLLATDDHSFMTHLQGSADDCDGGRREMAQEIISARENNPQPQTEYTSGELLKVLGILHRNAFKFGRGIALLVEASMFNHSCSPNAVITVEFTSDVNSTSRRLLGTVRALRSIAAGEEVCISYVPLGLSARQMRQDAIFAAHSFLCGCATCGSGEGEMLLWEQKTTISEDKEQEDREEQEREEDETHDMSLDPLMEIIDMAADNLAVAILEEKDHPTIDTGEEENVDGEGGFHGGNESAWTAVVILSRVEVAADRLRLGKYHFLRWKALELRAEANKLLNDPIGVAESTTIWVKQLTGECGVGLFRLCDAHLLCRMLTLRAEALVELAVSSSLLYRSNAFVMETHKAISEAIEQATVIYGADYALVRSLSALRRDVDERDMTERDQKEGTNACAQGISRSSGSYVSTHQGLKRRLEDDSSSPCYRPDIADALFVCYDGNNADNISGRSDVSNWRKEKAASAIVARLVGFATGLDYGDIETLRAADRLLSHLEEIIEESHASVVVVFDGDSYSDNSFTFLIPEILRRFSPKVELWAIVPTKKDFRLRFVPSWESIICSVEKVINVIITSIEVPYAEFAIRNHELVKPDHVLCFGGGNCVLKEYESVAPCVVDEETAEGGIPERVVNAKRENIFSFFDGLRFSAATGEKERSALYSIIAPS